MSITEAGGAAYWTAVQHFAPFTALAPLHVIDAARRSCPYGRLTIAFHMWQFGFDCAKARDKFEHDTRQHPFWRKTDGSGPSSTRKS